MRTFVGMVVAFAAACGSKRPATPPTPPPGPPTQLSTAPPPAIDAGVIAPPDAAIAVAAPALAPLAGKSPQEQWEWARPQIAGLDELVPQPTAPDFGPLGLKNGKITLYTPHLELALASKQLAPCTALPMKLDENGALATRIAIDGSRVRTDIKDKYVAFSLGLWIDDHEAVIGDSRTGYADAGIGGTLSEVTSRGLRYEGADGHFVVKCMKHVVHNHCDDGSTKVCESCEAYAQDTHVVYGSPGLNVPHSKCEPCPPDPVAPLIEPLNKVLQAHPMMRVNKGSGPAFFTRLADCKAALRAKPATKD